jgi:acyl carrier protein
MSDILERVRKIVIEHLDADPEKVTEKASFIDDLGADSLDNVELVMAFEEEFDIEIPDDAAEHIQTVGDAVKFIAERWRLSAFNIRSEFDRRVAEGLPMSRRFSFAGSAAVLV